MTARQDMKALLDNIYTSFGSGDASAYLADLAEDVVCIGTDEAEWWVGRDETARMVEAQLGEMSAAGVRVTGGDPEIGESGEAIWAADRATIHLPDGSEAAVRATFIATREGDRLTVRQMHLSAPASNEEVVHMPLTTE
jgi:ketosteroid isomerase-like protein